MSNLGTVEITSYPATADVEWTVHNFWCQEDRRMSPDFNLFGKKWCLAIWPKGWIDSSRKYVDLELYLMDLSNDPIRVELSVALKTVTGKTCMKAHGTKTFYSFECKAIFDNFALRSELSDRRLELVSLGALTVICSMKHPTPVKNIIGIPYPSNEERRGANQSEFNGSNEIVASSSNKIDAVETTKSALKRIKENCKEDSTQTLEYRTVEKLQQDFEKMMVSGYHSDIIVKVRGEEFRLHQSILGARSQFFFSKFNNENEEMISNTLVINNCDPSQFRTLIHFIYTGKVDNMCPESVCDLYEAAVAYQEHQLKTECLQFMMNTISVENFCDYASLALKHEEAELLQKATEMFIHKVKKIIRHIKWQEFIEKYPKEVHNFYIQALGQDDESK